MFGSLDSKTGILIVGHGTRDPAGNGPVLDLCRSVETQLKTTPVQPCFLELVQPSIGEGLVALNRRGVSRVIVVPLQLTAGRHVREDIPSEVGKELAKLSNMAVGFSIHLGGHPGLAEIAHSRLKEALAGRHGSPVKTQYLLVARGSRDPLVRGEVSQWVAKRYVHGDVAHFILCFLGMTEPGFEAGLQEAIGQAPDRIVVQPHLLFSGRLYRRIQDRVAALAKQYPRIEWVTTGPLGPDTRLAGIAVDLAISTFERYFGPGSGAPASADQS